jgi:hypothetical protein
VLTKTVTNRPCINSKGLVGIGLVLVSVILIQLDSNVVASDTECRLELVGSKQLETSNRVPSVKLGKQLCIYDVGDC